MRKLTLDQFRDEVHLLEVQPFNLLLKDPDALDAFKPFIFNFNLAGEDEIETYWLSVAYYLSKGYNVETYRGFYTGCPQKIKQTDSYFAIIDYHLFEANSLDELVDIILSKYQYETPVAITDKSFIDLQPFWDLDEPLEPFILSVEPNPQLEEILKIGAV